MKHRHNHTCMPCEILQDEVDLLRDRLPTYIAFPVTVLALVMGFLIGIAWSS